MILGGTHGFGVMVSVVISLLVFVSCPWFGLMDNGRCQNVLKYISMYIQLDNVLFPTPYAVHM